MKSKTSFFNKGIFKNLLERYWPAWALYAAVWFLIMPVNFLSNATGTPRPEINFVRHMDGICGTPSVFMAFVCAIITATGVFSFMFRQRETSMVASLPVKRESVFFSVFLSGLLPAIAINLLIALLSLLTIAGHVNSECVSAVFIWFGTYTLEFIAFYGIASIIAMLTGSIVALPILYAIFNGLAIGIEFLIRALIDVFVYGLSTTDNMAMEFLSPVFYIFHKTECFYSNADAFFGDMTGSICPKLHFEGWGIIAVYAVVGLLLAFCAMLLYRRRRMECTGDVVAIPALKPVFKYGVSVCMAICFGLLIYLIFWDHYNAATSKAVALIGIIVSMAIGGAVGYFGADMLLKKSTHVFKGNWKGCIAVAIACAALCLVCCFDVFGLGTYVPDESKIESVKITGSYTDLKLSGADAVKATTALHESIVSNLNEIAKNANEMFDEDDESYYYSVSFEYTLKNGNKVNRWYQLKGDTDEAKQYVEFMESDTVRNTLCEEYSKYTEADVANSSISYCVNANEWYSCDLTNEQAVDLYKNAVALDIIEGSMGLNCYDPENEYTPTLWIEFSECYRGNCSGYIEFSCFVTPDCVHTIQWFKDNLGADLSGMLTEPIVNEALGESTVCYG